MLEPADLSADSCVREGQEVLVGAQLSGLDELHLGSWDNVSLVEGKL